MMTTTTTMTQMTMKKILTTAVTTMVIALKMTPPSPPPHCVTSPLAGVHLILRKAEGGQWGTGGRATRTQVGVVYRQVGVAYHQVGVVYRLVGVVYRLVGVEGDCQLHCREESKDIPPPPPLQSPLLFPSHSAVSIPLPTLPPPLHPCPSSLSPLSDLPTHPPPDYPHSHPPTLHCSPDSPGANKTRQTPCLLSSPPRPYPPPLTILPPLTDLDRETERGGVRGRCGGGGGVHGWGRREGCVPDGALSDEWRGCLE